MIIKLNRGYESIIDDDDFIRISQYKWKVIDNKGRSDLKYSVAYLKDKAILMHRLIMNPPNDMCIDHIDGNGLNNQKSNLRQATHTQNLRNSKKKTPGSSIYKGVYFCPRINHYRARITLDGKRISLGYFLSEKDAGLAYDKAAKELFGEFCNLNFPLLENLP